jgi:hypothetical protein
MRSNVKARDVREKRIGLVDAPARRPSMSRAQNRYQGKRLVSSGSFDRHELLKTSALLSTRVAVLSAHKGETRWLLVAFV